VKEGEMGGTCGTCEEIEIHAGCWWGNLKEILGRPDCKWEDDVKRDLQKG
jgi:hypothetical protein